MVKNTHPTINYTLFNLIENTFLIYYLKKIHDQRLLKYTSFHSEGKGNVMKIHNFAG